MKTYFITIKSFIENENKLLYLQNFNIDPIIVYGVNYKKDKDYIDCNMYIDPYYKTYGPEGSIGCSLSHIKTWNRFLKTNDEYAMIIEDDVVFEDNYNSIIKNLDLQKIKDFELLYLGYIGGEYKEFNIFKTIGKMLGISREEKKITNNIIIPTVSLATHAYIISRKGVINILEIIKNKKINNHIDYYLHSINNLKCYACHPRIAFQTSTDTMNSVNVKSSFPILLNSVLNNIYIDKLVRANYLTCVSFARIGSIDINIISIFFIISGVVLSLSIKKIDMDVIKKITLFYLLLSIPDIIILKNTNNINIIILNYILFITPLIAKSSY